MMATVSYKVKLQTFNNWNYDTIEYETETIDSTTYVTKVWCTLCQKHKEKLKTDFRLRGVAKTNMLHYILGTKYIGTIVH